MTMGGFGAPQQKASGLMTFYRNTEFVLSVFMFSGMMGHGNVSYHKKIRGVDLQVHTHQFEGYVDDIACAGWHSLHGVTLPQLWDVYKNKVVTV